MKKLKNNLINNRFFLILTFCFFFFSCLSPNSFSSAASKKLLGLYKSSEKETDKTNYVYRFCREPLQKLGYQVDYLDIEKGLPSQEKMKGYKGIITWFKTPTMPKAKEYCTFLADQIANKKKVIILGNFGALQNSITVKTANGEEETFYNWLEEPDYNNFFHPFGLLFLNRWTKDRNLLEVAAKSSEMVEKDIKLKKSDLNHYFYIKSINSNNREFLNVKRKDGKDEISSFIVQTPYGGFVLEGYLFTQDPKDWKMYWRLDLEKFLAGCLNYKAKYFPKPLIVKQKEKLVVDDIGITTSNYLKKVPVVTGGSRIVPYKRRILGLLKREERDTMRNNLLHNQAEVILNHLGLTVDYAFVEDKLPDQKTMEKYLGVITWFNTPEMKNPERYIKWAGRQIEDGKKYVVLDNFGAFVDKETYLPVDDVNQFFHKLGIHYVELDRLLSPDWSVKHKDSNMVEFETPLKMRDIDEDKKFVAMKITADVYLQVEDPEFGPSDVVVITKQGGLTAGDYVTKDNATPGEQKLPRDKKFYLKESLTKWRINPFRFFREAFGIKKHPAFDTTTLLGSRIFYSHIDGDGFTGVSRIDLSSYSSQYVIREILRRYQLPVSASIIAQDIIRNGRKYYNRSVNIAQSMFKMPNVETGSHTFYHPFNWMKGDPYVISLSPKVELGLKPTDIKLNIDGSFAFVDELVGAGSKDCKLLLWSGNCEPSPLALKSVDRLAGYNLNGGDPVYDKWRDSYTRLCPLTSWVGGRQQYHTSASNDYLYTDGWTKNFDGMKDLVSHFEMTDSPIRIEPLNIYYHFYIGDRQKGLEGLKIAHEYCANKDIAPLFATDYVKIVKDFWTSKIFEISRGGWIIENLGFCRTVRFDTKDQYPDLDRSINIIGFNRINDSLYIHLDESKEHLIHLTKKKPEKIYIKQASHYVNEYVHTPGKIAFNTEGTGPFHLLLENMPLNSKYKAFISHKGKIIYEESIRTNLDSELRIKTRLPYYRGKYRVEIKRI